MDKLTGETLDLEKENIERIKELFPQAITEGKIDFDTLKILLGNEIDDKAERYQFTWNGKSRSIKLAQTPSTGTLIPAKEESKDWDTTENLYIEGDNLEVLKLLQKTYYGKIKMIYIDPPYNTGGDFVYKDRFQDTISNYKEQTNQTNRANPETSGRFHTDWLNMIYSRLILGRNLLSDDGVIFISIDDNEESNLSKICNEVFGEKNFVAKIIVDGTPKNDPLFISTAHEYCLVYFKSIDIAKTEEWGIRNPIFSHLLKIAQNRTDYELIAMEIADFYKKNKLTKDNISNYKYIDEKGIFRLGPIDDPQRGGPKDVRFNPMNGKELVTPNSGWRCNLTTWNQWISEGLVYFPEDNTNLCSKKTYITEDRLDLLRSYFKIQTRKDTERLQKMFGSKVFSFPKPLELIKTFINGATQGSEIVLDFFAGSSTTAEAVMRLNSEDGGSRRFIMVQLPENLEENLKSATSNREKEILRNAIHYCEENNLDKKLTEISKERIRKSGEEIKIASIDSWNKKGLLSDEKYSPDKLDVGFKVFKLESTNIKPWDSTIEFDDSTIFGATEVIKENRNKQDVLYEVMLKYGVFDRKVDEVKINGKTIYCIGERYIVVCLLDEVEEKDVLEIGKLKPNNVIFLESGFKDDNDKINAVYTLVKMGVSEVKGI